MRILLWGKIGWSGDSSDHLLSMILAMQLCKMGCHIAAYNPELWKKTLYGHLTDSPQTKPR
jgi:hypothetical protein